MFPKDITKLPYEVVQFVDGVGGDLLVETPFGKVTIPLKSTSYSIFGGKYQTDKNLMQICAELEQLEKRSKNYLLDGWLIERQISKTKNHETNRRTN
jgi:hypothetical protein